MFEVGEKVVCIADDFDWLDCHYAPCGAPSVGDVCVVTGMTHKPITETLCLQISGHPVFERLPWGSMIELGFKHFRFRKLSDMQAEARARHSKPENITES